MRVFQLLFDMKMRLMAIVRNKALHDGGLAERHFRAAG